MVPIATFRIFGDYRKDLGQIIKRNGLIKRLFRNQFYGNGVELSLGHNYEGERSVTTIEIYADENDIARTIYEQLDELVKELSKTTGVIRTVSPGLDTRLSQL